MKTACVECGFENLSESDYCQECGHNLNIKSSTNKTGSQRVEFKHTSESLHRTIEKIDDVIFKPKKKGFSFKNVIMGVILLGGLGFGSLLVLAILANEDYTASSDINATVTYAPTPTLDNTVFTLASLTIENLDAEWVDSTFYLKGVLKNTNERPAGNISVRVDFYWDEEQAQLFDTRFIELDGVSAKGAFSFYEPVYINTPEGDFWYVASIVDANYLD